MFMKFTAHEVWDKFTRGFWQIHTWILANPHEDFDKSTRGFLTRLTKLDGNHSIFLFSFLHSRNSQLELLPALLNVCHSLFEGGEGLRHGKHGLIVLMRRIDVCFTWVIALRRHEEEQPDGNCCRYACCPRKEMFLPCPLPKRRNPFLVNCIHLLVQPSHEVLFATHLWMVGMEYVVKFLVFHSSSFNLLTFPLNVIFLSTGLL